MTDPDYLKFICQTCEEDGGPLDGYKFASLIEYETHLLTHLMGSLDFHIEELIEHFGADKE